MATDGHEYLNCRESGDFSYNHQGTKSEKMDTLNSLDLENLNSSHNGAIFQLADILNQKMNVENIADVRGGPPTIPINDLRGEGATKYSREECIIRRSLASLYRLIDIRGWTHSIYNHISARCTDNPDHFLINPFGLLYHEIQASSLVKIDFDGNVVQQGNTVMGVNKAAWTLHSALHAARSDVNCVLHIHVPDVIAVSCLRAGLLPVSSEAAELLTQAGVCYHDYRGILVDESERASLQTDLGPRAKVLFLRNHGVVVAARSVAEAWFLIKRVVAACQTQMRMLQLSASASLLSELKECAASMQSQVSNCNNGAAESSLVNGCSEAGDGVSPEQLEFEAEMRVLDSAGLRTGHVYRQPNLLRHALTGDASPQQQLQQLQTGAELTTTDWSANEDEDLTQAAEAAGAAQVAKIADHVRANRQKSAQRQQWLTRTNEPGIVTSSLLASPTSTLEDGGESRPKPPPFQSPRLSQITPVRRNNTDELSLSDHEGPVSPATGGVSLESTKQELLSWRNRSATLPASVHHLTPPVNAHSNTLHPDERHPGEAGKGQTKKKFRKIGSFRIPSFSRKKKA